LYVQINGTRSTRNNVTKTFVADTGDALTKGSITAQINTTAHGVYNVTYELLSGADFLTVQADADTVTAGLRFAIDAPSTDLVYIDGQQRGAGVYTENDIDFGYGIGQHDGRFAGVVAGNGFSQVGYNESVDGNRYELNLTGSGDSIILVPFTSGTVDDVEDRESVTRDGVIGRLFSYPAPNFGYELSDQKTVRASLLYDHLEITGITGTLSPGTHQLLIANNGVTNGTANISITVK